MSLATFRLIAPNFSAVDDATVEGYLDLAATRMHAVTWGGLYPEGLANLAAHIMTRAGVGGQGLGAKGPVLAGASGGFASMSTGRESLSFGAGGGVGQGRAKDGSDDELTTTRFGLAYISLRGQLAPALTTTRWRR